MAVTLNTALSTHRSSANKVQKQKFGTVWTASATKDAIGLDMLYKKTPVAVAVQRVDEAMAKEDTLGKKLLQMFKDQIMGKNKN